MKRDLWCPHSALWGPGPFPLWGASRRDPKEEPGVVWLPLESPACGGSMPGGGPSGSDSPTPFSLQGVAFGMGVIGNCPSPHPATSAPGSCALMLPQGTLVLDGSIFLMAMLPPLGLPPIPLGDLRLPQLWLPGSPQPTHSPKALQGWLSPPSLLSRRPRRPKQLGHSDAAPTQRPPNARGHAPCSRKQQQGLPSTLGSSVSPWNSFAIVHLLLELLP